MTTAVQNSPTETQSTAPVAEVDAAAARRWLDSGEAVLIDVREPDEHAREHVRSSILMPLSRFDPAALAPFRGRRIVVHCRSGRRSAEAIRLAGNASPGLVNLRGGIEAWKAAGQPVEVNPRAARISVMRQVQIVVGVGVAAGVALGAFVDPLWLILPAFFGLGLAFAGATGTCALASVLSRMPWNRAAPAKGGCDAGRCG